MEKKEENKKKINTWSPKITLSDSEKIQNVEELINHFSQYFGINFEEMKQVFLNCNFISETDIVNYIKNNKEKMWENQAQMNVDINIIITSRIQYYQQMKNKLLILANRGLNYLEIINYIANSLNIFEENKFYETILKKLDLFHYGKHMMVEDINYLINTITHIYQEYSKLLRKINHLETYHQHRNDNFNIIPEESKDYYLDYVDLSEINNSVKHQTKKKKH